MTVTRLALVGDSLTQGTGPTGTAYAYAQGGQGSWAELVRDRLANLSGIGPLISPGLRYCSLGRVAGADPDEWAQAGTWTACASTDAFDKVPYGFADHANGSANTRTYTVPAWMPPWHGFAIDWIDYASGGNWSYRINGGAWTAMGQTLQNDNHYCRFYVTATVNRGDTIDIRAADTAGTGVGCLPVGIRPFFLAPSTTNGLVFDNYAVNGSQLHNLVLVASGDRMAAFDTVRLGTGGAVASTPTHAVMMHINDVTAADTTDYANHLTALNARVSPLGPFGIINPWSCDGATYNQTQQSNYRAQAKTSAAGFTPPAAVLDLFDLFDAFGYTVTQNAKLVAAGLLYDGIHESQSGHVMVAPWIYWFIRKQILSLGAVPSSYTVSAKQAAKQYSGKLAAVQYAAGAPISI